MKGRLTLQQRLILPIILLGMITLLSNILAVFSINNVHANAGGIVDKSMVSEERLEDIRRSVMDIHRLALSHIVAADHATMIQLVQEIKAEEASLDEKLGGYEAFVSEEDREAYQSLLNGYAQFKHALVYLVSASADSKTQEAYATANGDVALWSESAEADIDTLSASVSAQAGRARGRLTAVYIVSLVTSAVTLAVGIFLVMAAFRIIRKYVLTPIQNTVDTLQDSSERISGVVGEVRRRAKNSNDSVRSLSGVTEQLSAALEEIAGSAAAITASTGGTRGDTQSMAEELEQTARREMDEIRDKTADIMAMLDQAIEKSRSVEQIRTLTEDIISISSSTTLIAVNASIEAARAGAAGSGFSVVAQEVHKLADSCAETANHIQKVSKVVMDAVEYLSGSARELADYLSEIIMEQLERSVQTGRQYREDSDYIGHAMEEFNDQAERLKNAMDQIAVSISSISSSIDGAASGLSGAAGSTRVLVDEMEGISGRMDANQEIVGELEKQMDIFANL